jgi:2-polyprenyl-3-methyl-5-hydroxy-6-metoxy-1,4-benzoquinol methylase
LTTQLIGQADLAFQANLYESGNPTRRWLHRRRHEWVISRLQAHAGAGTVAFDCGVGCGVYTKVLLDQHAQVVGIDVNERFVDAANGLQGVTAKVADICRPETIGCFGFAGVAVCSEVLEHVQDPQVALSTLHDVLAPGGILILTTPQKWSTTELTARLLKVKAFEKLARLIYKEPVEELGHISLQTAAELQAKIRHAGFEVVEHECFAFYLPAIAEFGGKLGQTALAAAEKLLRGVPGLRWLLWTQAYVLRKV